MRLKELKCPTCGANLVPKSPQDKIIMCEYCGTVVYLEEDTKIFYVGDISQKERGETELAMIALKSGNYKDAKVKFEQAISNNVNNNVAWLGKAASDLHLGNLNESKMAFEKTISLGSPPEMIISWGNYLIETANYYERSIYAEFDDLISRSMLTPAQKQRYYAYFNSYITYKESIIGMVYSYLLNLSYEDRLNEDLIGYVLQLSFNLNDYQNMYSLSTKILEKNPSSTVARYYKGVAALYLGKYNETIDLLYPLIQEMPNNYNVYVFLAYGYARIGHYEYASDLLLHAYARLHNTTIANALHTVYGEWYNKDKSSAKRWRSTHKKEIKSLGLFL